MGESLLARATRAAGGPEALLAQIGPAALAEALREWQAIAREEQLPPAGAWAIWLILAGRGWGKTMTGAEWIKQEVDEGRARRVALIAPTAADARDTMVEGETGILSLYEHLPEDERPKYEPSKRRLTWPTGARATTFSAEQPRRLRGPQHDTFWADELAAWEHPDETFDQLQFGLRLGDRPRGVITTTPRPIPIIKRLIGDATVAITRGSTYENAVNLPPAFLAAIRRAYEGTRLGRQEINAEILDDNPAALWRYSQIEAARVREHPDLRQVAGGVDPAVTSNEQSDDTGIVFAGTAECRCKGEAETHAFVLEDASGIYTPDAWAKRTKKGYDHHRADRIIGEVNNGGDLVESNLRTLGGDANISFEAVHASRGKEIRAEPIASLYEQGKVHHVGAFPKLEDEMTQWNPLTDSRSPSRMDALVWVLTYLMLGDAVPKFVPTPRHLKERAKRRW